MKKRLLALCLTLVLTGSVGVSANAAAPAFEDVPAGHWAVSYINDMAEGGLVAGYGDGKFGPEDPFNIDQMCTIICSVKGYPQSAKNGYWAYGAVDYCLNTLKCLPSYGEINQENYSVPVTRELGYYMLMTGLGKGYGANVTAKPQMTATDIPDYASINVKFQPAVLKAYQNGVAVGTDDKLTFEPKAVLSRAQGVTMLVRAGWTKASTVATPVAEGRTIDEIYAAFMASDKWEEAQGDLGMVLRYKDKTCGTIEIETRETYTGKRLFVSMYERSPIGNGLIDNSAFKPAGRQVVKSVLDEIFPTKSQDAYMALKDVMFQTIYEYGGVLYPSAIRWYDGRMLCCSSNSDSHVIVFDIGELNDENVYNIYKAEVRTSGKQKYISYAGGYGADPEAFELDKW